MVYQFFLEFCGKVDSLHAAAVDRRIAAKFMPRRESIAHVMLLEALRRGIQTGLRHAAGLRNMPRHSLSALKVAVGDGYGRAVSGQSQRNLPPDTGRGASYDGGLAR